MPLFCLSLLYVYRVSIINLHIITLITLSIATIDAEKRPQSKKPYFIHKRQTLYTK